MKHTISVLVENKFGVLARISGLFSGRGFNIDSLTVGPTHDVAHRRARACECESAVFLGRQHWNSPPPEGRRRLTCPVAPPPS